MRAIAAAAAAILLAAAVVHAAPRPQEPPTLELEPEPTPKVVYDGNGNFVAVQTREEAMAKLPDNYLELPPGEAADGYEWKLENKQWELVPQERVITTMTPQEPEFEYTNDDKDSEPEYAGSDNKRSQRYNHYRRPSPRRYTPRRYNRYTPRRYNPYARRYSPRYNPYARRYTPRYSPRYNPYARRYTPRYSPRYGRRY